MNDWSMLRKLIWLHVISGGGSSGARTTVTGVSPLALANALAKPIRSLIQYGKVTTSNGEMYCNNGKLVAVGDELSVVGTPEVLTVGEQAATVENLLAVDDIKDEQDIISGTVTRRCEAVISDGTTPSGRYIGEVGEGNIIVKVRETGYEGDVATFEADRAEPLNGLSVNVEPTQDLHGYDSPWPAGGGRNLFNWDRAIGTPNPSGGENSVSPRVMDTERYYVGLTRNNYYYPDRITQYSISNGVVSLTSSSGGFGIGFPVKVDPSTVYAVSYADATNAKISEGFYDADWNFLSHIDAGVTFTTPANAAYVALVVTPINVGECSLSNIQLELGSTATSFAPYSNICPISGRTSATVTRTGINIFDKSEVVDNTYINENDGTERSANGSKCTGWISVVPGEKYYILTEQTAGAWGSWYDRNKSFISPITGYLPSGSQKEQTAPSNAAYMRLTCARNGSGNIDTFSVNYPSTDHDYHPYQGNTYTIQLGDTVYGGTLDVTGGKMMVDRAMVDLGILNLTYDALKERFRGVLPATSSASQSNPGARTHCLCSIYKTSAEAYVDSNRTYMVVCVNTDYAWLRDNRFTDVASFKTAMSGVQLCYELATPFEISLTPTQIETLLGTNNIWSDAGSVKAYVADGDVIEHVTPQPLRTAEGSNTVSVTSAVAPVQLSATYTASD